MRRPLIFLDPFPRTEAMVYTPETAAQLETMGEVVTHFGSRAPDALVERILPDVTAIIGQTAMPAARLRLASKLRVIINVKGNWENTVDYETAQAMGVPVLSAAPAMAPAVAEFCLCQALALARGLHLADALFRSGAEAYGIKGTTEAYGLFGADAAMVGFGNLGRALKPLLEGFGARIMVHDPWLSDGYLRSQGVEPVGLDVALAAPRFLFLLAGVTSENEGGLTRVRLETIRDDAVVVLASRAEIVDFEAFLDLAAQRRFRAAVDVYPREPVAKDSAVRRVPHVLFSSHLAGGTRDSYRRLREMVLDDLGQILRGFPPQRLQRAEPKMTVKMRSR